MIGTHLVNHTRHAGLYSDSTLHVIGVVSNPQRYQSRYRLAREWINQMRQTSNVALYLVEAAYGDRKHELTDPDNDNELQVRVFSEEWIKESMINLAARSLLPPNWKYIAWVDCDVFFRRPDWALETIHQLQHYKIVQPWEDCSDLGPHGNILHHHKSIGSLVAKGIRRQRLPLEPYAFGHPGYAWACTRFFWENTQGLMDFAILGSGDHHMATAMINDVFTSVHAGMTSGFKEKCVDWQYRATRITQSKIGYVPGVIEHGFHGSKKNRFYRERWQILIDHKYDPKIDLYYDHQGLVSLYRRPDLQHAIHEYNRSRQEDSIDV